MSMILSQKFSSSRTFPGHGYPLRISIASGENTIRRAPPNLAAKCATRSGMSDVLPLSGGMRERHDVQTVKEVLAELAPADQVGERTVGRGDDADVDGVGLLGADALDFLFLHGAEQLRLERLREGTDLVEEDRAAMGEMELALLGPDGARESAPHVAEELALEKVGRDRGAVDRDQTRASPRAIEVDRARDELLARSAFPRDQDRSVGAGDLSHDIEDRAHRGREPDDVREIEPFPDGLPEAHVFLLESPHAERLLHGESELVAADRLCEVVGGACLHRLDRRLHRPESGEHDYDDRVVDLLYLV